MTGGPIASPTRRTGPRAAPGWVVDAVETAVGRRHRAEPVRPRTGGPAGNATLTAWLGLLLLVALLAELVTLLDVSGLLAWHAGLGVVIGALVVAKTATTSWRVLRFYRGSSPYVAAGPPPLLFRVLGPLVGLTGLATIGSGITLVALGPVTSRHVLVAALGQRVDAVTVHQVAFIAFATTVGLHVLGRLVPAVAKVTAARRARVPGTSGRIAVGVAALGAAVVGLAVVLPLAGRW